MNRKVEGIGVDAGIIMVADMDYLKQVPSPNRKELKRLGKVIEVPKGKYKVSWSIPDTWNGAIEGGNEIIKVTSGKVFVCDPCYCIATEGDDWGDWLDKTDFCNELNNDQAFTISSMGGDGCYEVNLEFTKV